RGPQHRMLVMAGGNHIRYGFGIPRRVYRRLPSSYVLVGNYEVELTQKQEQELGIKQQERRTMDVEMPRFPMPPYDYQIISAYEKLDIDQVKIGIYMKKSDDGVTVEKIVPDSAAAKAGLQPGDVLVALRDERINDNFDLIYALKQYKFGDETALTVERDGESLTLLVTFTPVTETPKMQHKK
ncbi:MAG: PDZ domain-containing protein, partial [Desulfuromonadales bacterium]|nr:PDZ domain-containing protein [Desulfuromonadales bacterium]